MSINARVHGHGQQVNVGAAVGEWKRVTSDAYPEGHVDPAEPLPVDFENVLANLIGDSTYFRPFYRDRGYGGFVAVALRCATDTGAFTTPAKYVLVGRKIGSGHEGWSILPNVENEINPTITFTPETAVHLGSSTTSAKFRTTPTAANIHDCMGCDEFLVLPTQDIESDGADSEAYYEAKVF